MSELQIVLEGTGQRPQVRQGACRRLSQVDHFDHTGSVWFAGDDYGARNDKRRVANS